MVTSRLLGELPSRPFSELRSGPFGELRLGPLGEMSSGPFGELPSGPFGDLRSGLPAVLKMLAALGICCLITCKMAWLFLIWLIESTYLSMQLGSHEPPLGVRGIATAKPEAMVVATKNTTENFMLECKFLLFQLNES